MSPQLPVSHTPAAASRAGGWPGTSHSAGRGEKQVRCVQHTHRHQRNVTSENPLKKMYVCVCEIIVQKLFGKQEQNKLKGLKLVSPHPRQFTNYCSFWSVSTKKCSEQLRCAQHPRKTPSLSSQDLLGEQTSKNGYKHDENCKGNRGHVRTIVGARRWSLRKRGSKRTPEDRRGLSHGNQLSGGETCMCKAAQAVLSREALIQ